MESALINLLLVPIAEAVTPLPAEVASEHHDGVLRVRMPSRAIVVAGWAPAHCSG